MNTIYRHEHLSAFEEFVPRPHLIAALCGQAEVGLTVLAAPAGYGKTWLAAQVAQIWAAPFPAAPVRLWTLQSTTTLMQALESFCALFGQRKLQSSLSADSMADTAMAAIAADEGGQGLVIDMDGAPPSKAVQILVAQVLLGYALRGRVLVACRNPWLLPVDRISARAPSKIFRAADLACSTEELAVVPGANAEVARRWVELTEGWPVLCGPSGQWRQLTTSTTADDALVDAAVSRCAEYMEHVLLGPMSPRDIRLLMQVSILDVIEPGILEAAGLSAVWSRLASLVEAGLPVSSARTDWDRTVLHPVFRRFLERRMAARLPAQYNELHRQAAEYFITVESIISIYRDEPFGEHLIQTLASLRPAHSEDEPLMFPGGATLQAAALNNAGLYDRGASIARLAIAEAEELGSRYVEYYGYLHYAMALHGHGRVTEAVSEYFQARSAAEDIFGSCSGEYRMTGLLSAYANWQAGEDDQAERMAGDLDGLWRLHAWMGVYSSILQVAVAISRKRGDRALENRLLEDFGHLAQRRALPRLDIAVQLARAQQLLADGQLETAELGFDAVLQAALAFFPDRSSTAAGVLTPIWLEKTRVALLRGQFEDATRALRELCSGSSLLQDGAILLEATLLETYVALRARRYRDVAQMLAQCVTDAERSGLRRPFIANAAFVMELVEYARTHALSIEPGLLQRAAAMASPGNPQRVPDERKPSVASGHLLLTDRETDILHLLIAEGTVKTHRRHLYEKLGSGLRAQAIARARELGLL
jgi:ATP/maltotriose-dependent transcriptional regulator MalT